MFENLGLAIRRQKKLIFIFFLTIFLPSVSLSIFGIRAIRNERFRLAKQVEGEHRRAADFIKTQINSRFKNIEEDLQNLAQHPSLIEKDYSTIREFLGNRLADNPLIDQIFVVYEDKEPLFPVFRPTSIKTSSVSGPLLKASERKTLIKAEEYEFKQKEYRSAISLYQELFLLSKDKNTQAQMLNNIARCSMQLKNYDQAIANYLKICSDYPECITSSRLPLGVIAGLQLIECYQESGDLENSLKSSLDLYRKILQKQWSLDEGQFKTYSFMAEEAIIRIISENKERFSLDEYKKEFERLKGLHKEEIKQWQVIHDIKKDIIPELRTRLIQLERYDQLPFRFSKYIDDRIFLVLAIMLPDKSGEDSFGVLGLNIKNEYLEDELLSEIIKDIPFRENTNAVISDLSGQVLSGNKDPSNSLLSVTEFFEDNFPPWRIELFRMESFSVIDLRKSFYFWTIITLIIVLTFGAVLIVRTIAHEMEILKIKSDFVSSVSHEFKTPLTSIKALTERLQEGKVESLAKMRQYFSVISQDTDKLTRLVRNILDFSKIEEGKKEYDFMETDVAQLVTRQIENFRKEAVQKGIKVHTQIAENIPKLSLDQDAISQALNNLLDNAAKFSSDRKEIFVSIQKDEDRIIIEIKDKGIGVPQDELDKIFDKFHQARNALKHSVKGTGLGLTLVKHIVEAHGGRISVTSKVGEGSTFSLIFSIKKM